MKLDELFSWENISFLGKSKFVNSFSYWFFIVPFISKLGYSDYLPFDLYVFFICSLCFGVSNVIYKVCCPDIIKSYRSPQDFISKGGNAYQLNKIIDDIDSETPIPMDEKHEKDLKINFSRLIDFFNLKWKWARYLISIFYFFALLLLLCVVYTNIQSVFGFNIIKLEG